MKDEIVSKISLIIVAKNEEFGIYKCLNSIQSMPLVDCEVICVDSGSTDKTLEKMMHFKKIIPGMKIFKCTGYNNSAIARNVGLKNSYKNIVFFIDGDIEVDFYFIKKSYNYIKDGYCDVITGQLSEIYYNKEYSKEIKRTKDRFGINKEISVYYSGGCFMANRSVLLKAGLWDERMERNQDIDYTLRLSRFGRSIAIPVSMGIHHTQEFNQRPMHFLKNLFPMFFGMIIRKNIDRPEALIKLMKNNRGYFIGTPIHALILLYITSLINNSSYSFFYIYSIVLILSIDVTDSLFFNKNIKNQILVHYIYPIIIFTGLFFNCKSKKEYTKIERIF